MEFRKIKLEELTILRNFVDHWNPYYIDILMTQITENYGDIYVLLEEDKIIGKIEVEYENDNKNETILGKRAHLHSFKIQKEYRQKNYGQFLINAVIKELTEMGYSEISLNVLENNDIANHIYNKLGFTLQSQHRKIFAGKYCNYNLLLKKLPPPQNLNVTELFYRLTTSGKVKMATQFLLRTNNFDETLANKILSQHLYYFNPQPISLNDFTPSILNQSPNEEFQQKVIAEQNILQKLLISNQELPPLVASYRGKKLIIPDSFLPRYQAYKSLGLSSINTVVWTSLISDKKYFEENYLKKSTLIKKKTLI